MLEPIGNDLRVNEAQQSTEQNVVYRGRGKNDYEKTPNADTFESQNKKHTGRKIVLGTIIAAGLAAACDFIFFEGRHVRGIGKWFKKTFKIGEKAAKDVTVDATEGTGKNAVALADDATKKGAEAVRPKAPEVKTPEVKTPEAAPEVKAPEAVEAPKSEVVAEAPKPEPAVQATEQPVAGAAEQQAAEAVEQSAAEVVKAEPPKLDFELPYDGNTVVVENGEIKKCINADGNEWHIDENTDPDFAARLRKAIEDKIAELKQ